MAGSLSHALKCHFYPAFGRLPSSVLVFGSLLAMDSLLLAYLYLYQLLLLTPKLLLKTL